MKRLILILFVLIGFTAFSQRTVSDTIYSNETVNFATMENARLVQVVSTTLGDSIAGTIALYGSVDGTSFTFLNYLSGDLGVASPKASLTGAELNQITLSNNLVSSWEIKSKYPFYRMTAVGTTANDTTLIVIKWSK